jgi:hypothetical protein
MVDLIFNFVIAEFNEVNFDKFYSKMTFILIILNYEIIYVLNDLNGSI